MTPPEREFTWCPPQWGELLKATKLLCWALHLPIRRTMAYPETFRRKYAGLGAQNMCICYLIKCSTQSCLNVFQGLLSKDVLKTLPLIAPTSLAVTYMLGCKAPPLLW